MNKGFLIMPCSKRNGQKGQYRHCWHLVAGKRRGVHVILHGEVGLKKLLACITRSGYYLYAAPGEILSRP